MGSTDYPGSPGVPQLMVGERFACLHGLSLFCRVIHPRDLTESLLPREKPRVALRNGAAVVVESRRPRPAWGALRCHGPQRRLRLKETPSIGIGPALDLLDGVDNCAFSGMSGFSEAAVRPTQAKRGKML